MLYVIDNPDNDEIVPGGIMVAAYVDSDSAIARIETDFLAHKQNLIQYARSEVIRARTMGEPWQDKQFQLDYYQREFTLQWEAYWGVKVAMITYYAMKSRIFRRVSAVELVKDAVYAR